jgi:hypothetical protein
MPPPIVQPHGVALPEPTPVTVALYPMTTPPAVAWKSMLSAANPTRPRMKLFQVGPATFGVPGAGGVAVPRALS